MLEGLFTIGYVFIFLIYAVFSFSQGSLLPYIFGFVCVVLYSIMFLVFNKVNITLYGDGHD